MENIDFCFTKDGSVGLYNKQIQDIYHSSYGAYSESLEKFVLNSDICGLSEKYKIINVLDICYGIGYNSKSLLNYCLKKGIKSKIRIDAIDYDENLVLISPFIKVDEYNHFLDKKITNLLINQFKGKVNYLSKKVIKLEKKSYFKSKNIGYLNKLRYDYKVRYRKRFILHNIYYHYNSLEYKNAKKSYYNKEFYIKFYCQDARNFVKNTKKKYHLIFLDAFTPIKTPQLWSIDFFKLLKRLLNKKKGKLITYSNSAIIRNTLIQLGFYLQKIYINNKPNGTIAALNPKIINENISQYDFGLYKTAAGLPFEDPDLNLSNEQILKNRINKLKLLNLQSTSSYIKANKFS